MSKPKNKKFSLVSKLIVAVIVAVVVVKPISLQIQIRELQRQVETLDDQINQEETVNADLKKSLDEGVTDESIAKIARDVLGYASPGERVFIDSSEQ
jgi:cell division protein FtsL